VVHEDSTTPRTRRGVDHLIKVSGAAHSIRGWEHGKPGEGTLRRSGRQLAASLVATRGQDRPTSSGAHPQAEAVRLRAPTVIGLEGPLTHGSAPSLYVSISCGGLLAGAGARTVPAL
jgi:hypothetical protein